MKEETIICGDFNIDISDTHHQQYKNLINSFNYEMQNAEPTRVVEKQGNETPLKFCFIS